MHGPDAKLLYLSRLIDLGWGDTPQNELPAGPEFEANPWAKPAGQMPEEFLTAPVCEQGHVVFGDNERQFVGKGPKNGKALQSECRQCYTERKRKENKRYNERRREKKRILREQEKAAAVLGTSDLSTVRLWGRGTFDERAADMRRRVAFKRGLKAS